MSSLTVISIGCESHPFDWWREHYKAVGRANQYTPTQIKEYWEYLKLARRFQKTVWKKT